MIDVAPAELVQAQPLNARAPLGRAAGEGHLVVGQLLLQDGHQLGQRLAADVAAQQPHRVRHAGIPHPDVVDRPAHQPDVQVGGGHRQLAAHGLVVVGLHQRRQQHRALPGEVVVGVEVHRLQARRVVFAGVQHAPVGLGEEREALGHQLLVGLRLAQTQLRAVVAHPAVEDRADQFPVLVHRAGLALARALGVLRAQPGLYAVGVALGLVVAAPGDQFQNLLLPGLVDLCAGLRVFNGRQQVGLEHVHWAQRLAPVVHGLEDRVGVAVVVGGNLDQAHLRQQPVDEVRQRGAQLGHQVVGLDVAVAGVHRLDGLVLAIRAEGLALEQCLDDRQPLGDVEVELGLAQVVAEDQRRQGLNHGQALRLGGAVQANQQQRQRGHALLAVDQVVLAAALADDDGAEEILSVAADCGRLVAGLVVAEELGLQVRQQLVDVLLLPLVLALVLVDGERLALQEDLHVAIVRDDDAHTRRVLPVNSSCIIPCLRARVLSRRAWRAVSSASMSPSTSEIAACSARERSGNGRPRSSAIDIPLTVLPLPRSSMI